MANWVSKGLRAGIKTTNYPEQPEHAPGVSPGRPVGARLGSAKMVDSLVERCPTQAIARCDESRSNTADAFIASAVTAIPIIPPCLGNLATNGPPIATIVRQQPTNWKKPLVVRCMSASSMPALVAPV